jgi:hypothetical protein
MPNWCTNTVDIEGDVADVTKAKSLLLIPDSEIPGELHVTFKQILPRHPDLDIVSGSTTTDAWALEDDAEAVKILGYPWVKELGITDIAGVRAMLRERYLKNPQCNIPTLDGFLERIKSNIERFDYADWYDWSCENWGTKWDACDSQILIDTPTHLCVRFDTAWSPPDPVLTKLHELVGKRLRIRNLWREEGGLHDAFELYDETE